MNRKQFALLVVLVLVLGGLALWHHRRQAAAWGGQSPQVGRKLLGDFQVNDVTQIRIRQGAGRVDLKQTNGLWRVEERGGYPADFSQISQLLLKIRDLKIVQTEPVGPSQLPRLDLASPSAETNAALLLELDGASGTPLNRLLLGKTHSHDAGNAMSGDQSWPDGRYVLTASNADTVAVIADPLSEVLPQPDRWLDKTFLKVTGARSVAVSYPAATNSWELVRTNDTGGWKLADARPGEKLDDTQASETADAFSSPSFNDVAVGLAPERTGLNHPTRVEIKTFDGFDYALNVGAKTNDNYFLGVNVSAAFAKTNSPDESKRLADKLAQESALNRWTYLVPTWTLDPLLKNRSQLLVAQPATVETNSPATNLPASSQTR